MRLKRDETISRFHGAQSWDNSRAILLSSKCSGGLNLFRNSLLRASEVPGFAKVCAEAESFTHVRSSTNETCGGKVPSRKLIPRHSRESKRERERTEKERIRNDLRIRHDWNKFLAEMDGHVSGFSPERRVNDAGDGDWHGPGGMAREARTDRRNLRGS